VLNGQVPAGLHGAMRVPYMEGDFSFPVKYGYSLVGRVVESDDADLTGRTVHLLHPHQDALVARNEDLFVVDASIPAARATLASNLETAVTAVWDSGVTLGQRCLVVGFGIIGSLVARLLSRLPGVKPVVVDSDASQRALAAELGFVAPPAGDVEGEFDCAFHASGSGAGLQRCLDRVGFEGRVLELSWYGTRTVQLELGGSFHRDRKAVIASQVSTIPSHLRGRWTYRRRKELVFELLRDPAFDRHITETLAFTDLPNYYQSGGLERPGLARVVEYPTDPT